MDPRLYDAAAVASGFVPGSGLMDFIGQAPAIGGGMGPSFMENLKKKQYVDAMLQMAGAAGDAMMVVPPVGMTVKAATTAGKTARAGSKTADALTTANTEMVMPSLKALQGEYYDATAKANELYGILRGGNKDPQVLDQYKQISARRDELYPQVFPKTPEPEPQGLMGAVNDYRGQHVAPTKDSGAPLWKLEDIYPEDFYSSSGARFYGDGAEPMRDASIVNMMQSMRGKPDAPVTVYRAVPKSIDSKKALNAGDWVTIDRQYAKEHGEGALQGDYKIVKKTVKARDLFTNADSIYEMGYDPQAMMRRK